MDISKIQLDDGVYNIKDSIARNIIDGNLKIIFPLYNEDGTDTDGDCIIFKTSNDKVFVIDTYLNENNFNAIKNVCIQNNINKIDYLLITHYHIDHYGNLERFINYFDMSECTVLIPRVPQNSNVYQVAFEGYTYVTSKLNQNNINYRYCENETIILDEVLFNLFNASSNDLDFYDNSNTTDYNNYSICTEVLYKDKKMLFCGDIAYLGQERCINSYINKSNYDLFKVPHHGYQYLNPHFANIINPKSSVITATRGMFTKNIYNNGVWENYLDNTYIIGYQNNPIIFDVNINGCILTTDNISYKDISLNQGYVQYYVDNNYTGLLQDGTQSKPFKTLKEALTLINKKSYSQINIVNINENERCDITGANYLFINGNNKVLPPLFIKNCKYVIISDATINSSVDSSIPCIRSEHVDKLELANIISDSSNNLFASISVSKVAFEGSLDLSNKYNLLNIYSNSNVLFNVTSATIDNITGRFFVTDGSIININNVITNYFKNNFDFNKLLSKDDYRRTIFNSNISKLMILYDGTNVFDNVTLTQNISDFDEIEITTVDNDNRSEIIKLDSSLVQATVRRFNVSGDATSGWLKSCVINKTSDRLIEITRNSQTTISVNNTITMQNGNYIGIKKVVGIIK